MTRLKRNTPGGSRSGNRVDPNQEIDWLPFRKLGGSHCGNWVAPVGGNFAIGDTLVQQSATSIFLPNHKATAEAYCGAFKLSEREFDLIRTMNPHDRCFLIKHGQDSVIAKLDLKGLDDFIRILSGTAKNVAILDEIRKIAGDDPVNWLNLFLERSRS